MESPKQLRSINMTRRSFSTVQGNDPLQDTNGCYCTPLPKKAAVHLHTLVAGCRLQKRVVTRCSRSRNVRLARQRGHIHAYRHGLDAFSPCTPETSCANYTAPRPAIPCSSRWPWTQKTATLHPSRPHTTVLNPNSVTSAHNGGK